MEFFGVLGLLASLMFLVLLGLVVIGILALVGRGEADLTGRRTYALYLFGVVFVSIFFTLFAAFAVVQSGVRLALPERGELFAVTVGTGGWATYDTSAVEQAAAGSTSQELRLAQASFSPPPEVPGGFVEYGGFDPDKEHWRTIVQMGLLAIASGLVLRWHAQRARELVAEPGFDGTPAWRTYQAYVHAVCFVAVFLLLFASASSLYGLFRAIAPGVTELGTGAEDRAPGVEQFVTGGLLSFAAYAIFRYHWALRRRPAVPAA